MYHLRRYNENTVSLCDIPIKEIKLESDFYFLFFIFLRYIDAGMRCKIRPVWFLKRERKKKKEIEKIK